MNSQNKIYPVDPIWKVSRIVVDLIVAPTRDAAIDNLKTRLLTAGFNPYADLRAPEELASETEDVDPAHEADLRRVTYQRAHPQSEAGPDDLLYPQHSNGLGDWCPWSGQVLTTGLAANLGYCPAGCRDSNI